MPAAADKQHERLHDPNAQFASLQELALRLLRSSDPHEIVTQALGWAAELGLGAAWLRVRPKATAYQIELTAGLERRGLRALQAAVFAATEASLPGYVV